STRSSPRMRMNFVGCASVSSRAIATGCQYRRSSAPPGVPGPTCVIRAFSSAVSIPLSQRIDDPPGPQGPPLMLPPVPATGPDGDQFITWRCAGLAEYHLHVHGPVDRAPLARPRLPGPLYRRRSFDLPTATNAADAPANMVPA